MNIKMSIEEKVVHTVGVKLGYNVSTGPHVN